MLRIQRLVKDQHSLWTARGDNKQMSETDARADLAKDPADVAAMFDQVAPRYDLMNDVLSGGQVYVWRQATINAISPQPGQRILDLAAGTGTSADAIARTGAEVVACDLSPGMVEVGRARYPELEFVIGNAEALPFPDDTFDAVTISFGIRNVQNVHVALKEMRRVTKPGGRLVVCEFSTPENPVFRKLYDFYLSQVLPRVARLGSSDAGAYQYLMETIIEWPDQRDFGATIAEAGWKGTEYRSLTGGIVALHRAWK